jgi:hypothetical protein
MPGLDGLFHAILHQRLVDDREHFLGHALGGGQKAGAIAGDGEHALADHIGLLFFRLLTGDIPR